MTNPWRPDWVMHPGEVLGEELIERGLSQADLARATGFSPKHINLVIKGKADIGPEFAIALEIALDGPSAEFWMNLEVAYRLGLARGLKVL